MDTLIPPPNAPGDIFTQVICMFALIAASLHSVRVRAAVSNLGQRDIARVVAMDIDKPEESLSKWGKRARQPKWAALGSMAITLTLYALSQLFFSYILPHYASQSVMDWVYGIIIWVFLSFGCGGAINTLSPVPTGVRYKRSDRLNTSSELIIEHIPLVASSQQPFVHLAVVRYTLAMLSGAIIVGGSAMGWSIFHAFAAATIILAFPYSGPVVKVKPLCLVILVFSAGCIAFIAIVGELAATFGPEPKKKEDLPKNEDTLPGFWILQFACACFDGFAWVLSGFLVAITMRFEHLEAYGAPLVQRDDSTQSVIIPTSAQLQTTTMRSKPTPLTFVGVAVIYCAMLGLHITSWFEGMAPMMFFGPMIGIFTVPSLLVGALMLCAKMAGKYQTWWGYCEVWSGKVSDLESGGAAFELDDEQADEDDQVPKRNDRTEV